MCSKNLNYLKYDIRDFSQDDYNKWYNLLDVDKKQRVCRFRSESDKKRTVCGEMLARKMISDECSIAPEEICFSYNEYGKPYATNCKIQFNISHSGDYVVCALDTFPVGIDIERIRPIDLSIAEKVFSKEEISKVYKDKTYTEFFKLWTLKEAYCKYKGLGICRVELYDFSKLNIEQIVFDGYCVCVISESKV